MEPSNLAMFWAAVICVSILIYVVLDGFDLGVGILFGTVRDEATRVAMMDAIAPVWNGNETWLVVIGASLFAAFPVAYVVFMGAFYIPVLLLLFGLRVALGLIDLHNLQKSQEQTMRALGSLAPHSYLEAGFFIVLSVFAGLFEEIIFRGFLFKVLSDVRGPDAAVVVTAILFALLHLPQLWGSWAGVALIFGSLGYERSGNVGESKTRGRFYTFHFSIEMPR